MKKILLVCLLGSINLVAKQNDGSLLLSVAGVANDRVSDIDSETNTDDLNYGFGALVEGNFNSYFGIETGALLIKRNYTFEAGPLKATQSVKRLHIPVLARVWPTNFFSIAGGGFTSIKTGSVDTELDLNNTNIADINTSADDSVEFGLEAAATLNFAVNKKTGLFVEGRYSQALGEESNEDSNHLMGLAGLKFNL